jgi:hypothetical protein
MTVCDRTHQVRTDYQLEPGVVQVNPENTSQVVDAITYPGINDALQTQGAFVNNADRFTPAIIMPGIPLLI